MLGKPNRPTLARFLAIILLWAMRDFTFVTFVSRLGIETSSGDSGGWMAVGLSFYKVRFFFQTKAEC
jgi:hypothetical protein